MFIFPGGSASRRGVCIQKRGLHPGGGEDLHPGGLGRPPVIMASSGSHCSGRYASYWNVFLLKLMFEEISCVNIFGKVPVFSLSGKMNIQIPRFYIFPVLWQPCSFIFTARKRSFRQDNVFTGVCLPTGGRGSLYDVTSCLDDGSNVPSRGSVSGPMFLWGVSLPGGPGGSV